MGFQRLVALLFVGCLFAVVPTLAQESAGSFLLRSRSELVTTNTTRCATPS